jgi:hypothetical protein
MPTYHPRRIHCVVISGTASKSTANLPVPTEESMQKSFTVWNSSVYNVQSTMKVQTVRVKYCFSSYEFQKCYVLYSIKDKEEK